MQAHNNNIEEFLGAPKTVFVVPVYQRNYDWKDDNCQQLFNDIVGIINSGNEHFLGTICFKVTSSHERAIIDGQQRLTSITLMLKAMYDYDDNEDNRAEIHDQYIYNKGRGVDTDFLRYKLHLNKRDEAVYHILLDNTRESVEEKLTITQRNSRIYQNYLLFYELVMSYVNRGGCTGDILEALRSLTVIELEIQKENPQEIFESLNSTGLDLTNVDLLRNYFLMQFAHEEQTRLYDDYWSRIEDDIGVDRMEQFFVDFLVFKKRSDAITINGRRNHINERSLYVAFKDYYLSMPQEDIFSKTERCFMDLKKCAEIYKAFVFSDDTNLSIETPMRKKLYFLLTVNESTKARSLLLYIFDLYQSGKINDAMLDEAVDGISSLTFRARICKAQGINRQFAGNVMQRLDEITDYSDFSEAFWQAITVGKGSYAFPSDAEFMDALVNKDMYRVLHSKGTKYFLYMLETHSPFPKGLPPINDETITVEHIMPQTLNTKWKIYLTKETMENYDRALHKVGNLALTSYNGEMSNNSFFEKRVIYKDSNFYWTRRLEENENWQIKEINDRSQLLANEALKIWALPSEYQNVKAVSESWHTLGEETAQFAYTKPAVLLIGNEEYSVSYWAEFHLILCELLDKENHAAFVEIANPSKISAFGINDEEHDYSNNSDFVHITEDIYIRQFMSSASILETMLKITKSFDEIAGTEYTDNILFSLK